MKSMRGSVPLNLCVLLAGALVGPGCGGGSAEPPPEAEPVVEVETTDGVTTVRNVSGSQWGAPARLQEELSIGVMDGAEEYMLGSVNGLWVTDDRVYVIDGQIPTVRVYDLEGNHLRDIGQGGAGPGEFETPGGLEVMADGTLVVADFGNRRLVFFSPEGVPLRTWAGDSFLLRPVALDDGRLMVGRVLPQEDESRGPVFTARYGIAPLGPDGLGDTREVPTLGHEEEPLMLSVGGRTMAMGGGFLGGAGHFWAMRPDGVLLVGVSDEYRFRMIGPDGETTVVERAWQPVPIDPEVMNYSIRMIEGQFRSMDPGYTYDGPDPATHWPAYSNLYTDRDNRAWLLRRVGSRRATGDCVEDPREDPRGAARFGCWQPEWVLDVFDREGRYLGELHRPEGLSFRAVFMRGDEYWAGVENADGVVQVKRFRIVVDED